MEKFLKLFLTIISISSITFASNWMQFTRKCSLLNTFKRSYFTYEDKLWVATFGDGIWFHDGKKWHHFTKENTRSRKDINDGLISNNVISIAFDGVSKILWVATDEGICMYDLKENKWSNFKDNPPPVNFARSIAIDSLGVVWFATYEGVMKYFEGKWTLYNEDDGITDTNIVRVYTDGVYVWAAARGGAIYIFKNNKWVSYYNY